jgi:hypothetical protein
MKFESSKFLTFGRKKSHPLFLTYNWISNPQALTLSQSIQFHALNQHVQSVQRLATAWTVRESNPGGDEIFRTQQTGPGATQPPMQMVSGLSQG